jgi:hypothetical protein
LLKFKFYLTDDLMINEIIAIWHVSLCSAAPVSSSQNQRCGCKDMAKRVSGTYLKFLEKWLGLYLEILSDSRGRFGSLVDHDLILDKNRRLFVKLARILLIGFIFEWEKSWNWLTTHRPGALGSPLWICE